MKTLEGKIDLLNLELNSMREAKEAGSKTPDALRVRYLHENQKGFETKESGFAVKESVIVSEVGAANPNPNLNPNPNSSFPFTQPPLQNA